MATTANKETTASPQGNGLLLFTDPPKECGTALRPSRYSNADS
jgi:hypothetical protein